MRRLLLLPMLVLAVLPVSAQHPNVERGFAPGQSFQIGDIDHVNLFNGSLVITIPIGQSYPVGGGLSYGLTLTYSSGVWDFREADGGEVPQPSRTSNAGLGWRVSLGRYYPWSDPDNDRGIDLYVGADGGEHWFYKTLHAGDADEPGDGLQPYQQTVQYTRDGSYLRSKKLASGWTIEFPDGQIHTFNSAGRLTRMEDRFGNYVNVTYGTGLWTLTDRHQRSQKIYFQSLPQGGGSVELVDRIELTAFGSATAEYDFTYTQATIRRACATSGTLPLQTNVQLLSSLTLPDGSSYQMPGYVTSATADCRTSGVISGIVLPTLGRLEWTWQRYQLPSNSSPKAPPWQYTAGVALRAIRYPDGVLKGVWSYQTSLTPDGFAGDEKELVNTVTDPLGHRTVNYFSVYPGSVLSGWSVHDYSLPFTRSVTDGAGRFLSTRVYNAAGTLLRSSYVRYERDQTWPAADLQDKNNLNRREASRRTVYEDDGAKYADVNHSNFDGLGHYRRSETGGNFLSSDFRVSTIGYNPGAGTYELDVNGNPKVGFTMVASTSRWLLGLYWDRVVSDGAAAEQDLNCFDGTNGFLLGRRILRTSGKMSVDDVLVLYDPDSFGNVIGERFYGGDPGGLSPTDTCGSVPATSQYRLLHTWQFGALATSKYDMADFFSVDRDIDARTGLPSADYDTSGLKTTYEYDAMGRRTWEMPDTGQGGQTEYVYSQAVSATDLADVLILRRANGLPSAAVLAQSQILFDPLGRVWREQRKLPSGSWSIRETLYDLAGNKTSVSEEQINNPSSQTQFLSYDPFGRPGTIRPPDGSSHDVTISYAGVRSVSRTVKIGNAYNATTGAVTETASTTTEIYDRQGRLWKVTEPSGAAGANITTTYTYDTRDRLRGVSTTAGATTQARTFVYDGLGFLRSETHPEKGATSNGTVTYADYDARGHFRQKIDVDTDLRYVYDRAERLSAVNRANGTPLKAFTYDTCTGVNNWCNGKVVKAERYNYPKIGDKTFTALIAETYAYGGRDGRVSQRDTQMTLDGTAGESFTQTFTWYHLGMPQQIGYPQCTHTGCAATAASPRTVENTFSEGLLSRVKVGTFTYGTLSYHPNLLVSQVAHANGITETQTLDSNNMRRPASFNAKLGTTTLWSSGTYIYDGAGNITKTGASWYLYDKVSRLVSSSLYDGATGGGALKTQTYAFDPFGNMTSIGGTSARNTPTSASNNRLAGTGVDYDDRGNLTNWNGAIYEYDDFNQMKRMLSGAEEWIYVYTAGDERVWLKRVGFGLARWTLRDLDAKVLREYTQDTAGWSASSDYLYRDGQLLATETPAGRKHFHLDHLGTPRLITNASGQKVAYHLYYPFGEEATAFSQDAERMKFTGHERDLASAGGAGDDLDYMHARHCSPVTGRFLSVDPKNRYKAIRSPRLWNRYAYSIGNPLKYVDPDGEDIVLASGGREKALKQFLVRAAMRPSARAEMKRIAESKAFTLTVSEKQLTSPANAEVIRKERGSQALQFGATTAVVRVDGNTRTVTGAQMSIDTAAVQRYHYSDRSGVATTAHEFFHAAAMFDQKSDAEVATGDKPSNATGPAAQFGDAAEEEEPDMTEAEAENFVNGILTTPPQSPGN
jgi:RHS repeat-associated protein